MEKIRLNKKNIIKVLGGISIGSVLVLGSIKANTVFDHGTNLYYIDTKSTNMSSEELLEEFKSEYSKSANLQSEWDSIYPYLCDFISDYGDCLDQDELLNTLPKLKIERVDNLGADNVLGYYDNSHNKIQYSEVLFFKGEEKINGIKLHEAFHYMFNKNFYGDSFSHEGWQLDEGNASLLVTEYAGYTNVDSYEKNTYYVRTICELIGTDNYMKAVGQHDISLLKSMLNQYSSKNEASDLIKYIDDACRYNGSYCSDNDMKAWNIVEKMYVEKNGISIEESNDIVMKVYANKLCGVGYEIPGARGYSNAFINKNYFNVTSKPTVTYKNFGKEYGFAYLNDDNEIESGEVLLDGNYDENGNVVDKDNNVIDNPEYYDFSDNTKHK